MEKFKPESLDAEKEIHQKQTSSHWGAKDNLSVGAQNIQRENAEFVEAIVKSEQDEEFLKDAEAKHLKATGQNYEDRTNERFKNESFFSDGKPEEYFSEDPTEALDRKITSDMLLSNANKYIKLSKEEFNDLDPEFQKKIIKHNERFEKEHGGTSQEYKEAA
jgi:hypothetical protein